MARRTTARFMATALLVVTLVATMGCAPQVHATLFRSAWPSDANWVWVEPELRGQL